MKIKTQWSLIINFNIGVGFGEPSPFFTQQVKLEWECTQYAASQKTHWIYLFCNKSSLCLKYLNLIKVTINFIFVENNFKNFLGQQTLNSREPQHERLSWYYHGLCSMYLW